jgi:phenylpyruvate tautomerase PptA (4-oxalocrotonate tautomerase family)
LGRSPRGAITWAQLNLQGSTSGRAPDARIGRRVEQDARRQPSNKEDDMPLIEVKALGGVFTAPQRKQIVERLTDAMVEIEGENMRPVTVCIFEKVPSGGCTGRSGDEP